MYGFILDHCKISNSKRLAQETWAGGCVLSFFISLHYLLSQLLLLFQLMDRCATYPPPSQGGGGNNGGWSGAGTMGGGGVSQIIGIHLISRPNQVAMAKIMYLDVSCWFPRCMHLTLWGWWKLHDKPARNANKKDIHHEKRGATAHLF